MVGKTESTQVKVRYAGTFQHPLLLVIVTVAHHSVQAVIFILQPFVCCSHFRLCATRSLYKYIGCPGLNIQMCAIRSGLDQLTSLLGYHQRITITGKSADITKRVCLAGTLQPNGIALSRYCYNDVIELIDG